MPKGNANIDILDTKLDSSEQNLIVLTEEGFYNVESSQQILFNQTFISTDNDYSFLKIVNDFYYSFILRSNNLEVIKYSDQSGFLLEEFTGFPTNYLSDRSYSLSAIDYNEKNDIFGISGGQYYSPSDVTFDETKSWFFDSNLQNYTYNFTIGEYSQSRDYLFHSFPSDSSKIRVFYYSSITYEMTIC